MFEQQTPSQRLRNVLTVLPGRSDLLSNPAANGSVTGTVGWGRARRKLPLVNRLPEGSPPDPTVAVVICARSEVRWDDLVAAVESVKQQTYRPAEIVLVIDHNPALQRRSTNELTGVTVVPNDNEGDCPAPVTPELPRPVRRSSPSSKMMRSRSATGLLRWWHPMPTHTCSVSADRWSPSGRRGVPTGSQPNSTGSSDAVTTACPLSEPECATSVVQACHCGVGPLSNPVVSMSG